MSLPLVVVVISIHAPAWGATNKDAIRTQRVIISIHAPAWGATIPGSPVYR